MKKTCFIFFVFSFLITRSVIADILDIPNTDSAKRLSAYDSLRFSRNISVNSVPDSYNYNQYYELILANSESDFLIQQQNNTFICYRVIISNYNFKFRNLLNCIKKDDNKKRWLIDYHIGKSEKVKNHKWKRIWIRFREKMLPSSQENQNHDQDDNIQEAFLRVVPVVGIRG